jgi:hypothetical protein
VHKLACLERGSPADQASEQSGFLIVFQTAMQEAEGLSIRPSQARRGKAFPSETQHLRQNDQPAFHLHPGWSDISDASVMHSASRETRSWGRND